MKFWLPGVLSCFSFCRSSFYWGRWYFQIPLRVVLCSSWFTGEFCRPVFGGGNTLFDPIVNVPTTDLSCAPRGWCDWKLKFRPEWVGFLYMASFVEVSSWTCPYLGKYLPTTNNQSLELWPRSVVGRSVICILYTYTHVVQKNIVWPRTDCKGSQIWCSLYFKWWGGCIFHVYCCFNCWYHLENNKEHINWSHVTWCTGKQ